MFDERPYYYCLTNIYDTNTLSITYMGPQLNEKFIFS